MSLTFIQSCTPPQGDRCSDNKSAKLKRTRSIEAVEGYATEAAFLLVFRCVVGGARLCFKLPLLRCSVAPCSAPCRACRGLFGAKRLRVLQAQGFGFCTHCGATLRSHLRTFIPPAFLRSSPPSEKDCTEDWPSVPLGTPCSQLLQNADTHSYHARTARLDVEELRSTVVAPVLVGPTRVKLREVFL